MGLRTCTTIARTWRFERSEIVQIWGELESSMSTLLRRVERVIRNKRFLWLLLLGCSALNLFSSVNALRGLSRKGGFKDVARGNWVGDAPFLGTLLSEEYAEYQPFTLIIPMGHNDFSYADRPFRFVYFHNRAYPYLFPGQIRERRYDYELSDEVVEELLRTRKHTNIRGRLHRFLVFQPRSSSGPKTFVMYRCRRPGGTLAIVLPEED